MTGDLDDFLSCPASTPSAPTGTSDTFSLLMPSAPAASLLQPQSGLPPAVRQCIDKLPDFTFMTAFSLVNQFAPKENSTFDIMEFPEPVSVEQATSDFDFGDFS